MLTSAYFVGGPAVGEGVFPGASARKVNVRAFLLKIERTSI